VKAFDLAVLELGGPAAFSIGAYPSVLLFNRVLGLDDDSRLPDLEAWFGGRRCTFAISVHPGTDLEQALAARGYQRGPSFMKFRRGVNDPPEPETSLRIIRIDRAHADEYGAVVETLFSMGPPLNRWFAALCLRAGWACFGALDGNRLVGTGASYASGGLGWLGAAGTLPEARGRGGQSAILAARIRALADAGIRVLVTETVDREEGAPGPSFRNVVRAGFEEAYVQQWWTRDSVPASR
jgi:hypothetical protein